MYFIGVDVGSASVRAGLFDKAGRRLAVANREIKIWSPKTDFYEQSSDDIWGACCDVVKNVTSNTDVDLIKGIGFDATCSLVALGKGGIPLTISPTGNNEQNIIMWMDHRARDETEFVNATQHPVLRFVGGKVSIEMQLPKLLWLKRNLPNSWKHAELFLDLPDFLTWKSTSSETRSQCSLVCKWNYLADEKGNQNWSEDFLQQIGLEDLLAKEAKLIGKSLKFPGEAQGNGLSEFAAKELGLKVGTPVGVSLIDAYAGALGLLACKTPDGCPIEERLAMICGTSSCHMLVVPSPLFVPGIWGPYAHVLLPERWLLEAGQSATGKLLDHIILTHPSCEKVKQRIAATSPDGLKSISEYLVGILNRAAAAEKIAVGQLTRDIHVWPDFHGNRSPLADPNLKGMICGLTLDTSEENLALLYLATVQALAYGTRHIVDSLHRHGAPIGCLLACGGLSKSDLFVSTMADALGVPVIIPDETESVLHGSAMLGACASGYFTSLQETMAAMGGKGKHILPHPEEKEFHERKYRVFLKMLQDQNDYDRMMNSE